MHGYDSVVGPVKGVYSKESAVTKAREHALLVSTRPSYVTILTLGEYQGFIVFKIHSFCVYTTYLI